MIRMTCEIKKKSTGREEVVRYGYAVCIKGFLALQYAYFTYACAQSWKSLASWNSLDSLLVSPVSTSANVSKYHIIFTILVNRGLALLTGFVCMWR